ncbi:glutamyl-tRNA reductase [Hathewaya proteolytica DSM 3090]|uniref:Glutamyl-tRNA reductase n=1 Tax=Hathewaya proteolytica DSM 3090 TaxID=1121331 RepID=A0A1M6RVM7_9CLOT|nr:glutamyl-tRNA reductase [Hathewaya proteolytica]SHK36357.1 glutamyl-tRNA reductase [Hathewaya proteolytica DSM 3090]
MHIVVIGVNHNDAPIEIREKVAFSDSEKIDALNDVQDLGMKEALILSTCNRSEMYIVCSDVEDAIIKLKCFYREFFKDEGIVKYLFIKKDDEAIHHIYEVAAGLDSIVIGEDQILGQVKDALQFSMEIGSSKKLLNKLFREAITAAKNIKSTLAISEIPLSTSYIAIKSLREELGSLEGRSILLIGAGKISLLALKYFEEEKVGCVYICNRTFEKVKDICSQCENLKMVAVEYEKRYDILKDVDIVFTATAASHLVLKKERFPEISKAIHIIDLAVPRDVERGISQLPMVHLYDVDDLKQRSKDNLRKREELSVKAKGIIESSIDEFYQWCTTVKFDPVIKSLNDRCQEIEEDTLEYINRKIQLNKKEQKIIEKMVKSSLKRLIREPINNLKELKNDNKSQEYVEMINKLFNF